MLVFPFIPKGNKQSQLSILNYINMPIQYTAIFTAVMINNFSDKKCDVFLIFGQNIDCRYMVEPPRQKWGVRGCTLHWCVIMVIGFLNCMYVK